MSREVLIIAQAGHYRVYVQFIIPVHPIGRHFAARRDAPRSRYSGTQHIRDNELVLKLYNMYENVIAGMNSVDRYSLLLTSAPARRTDYLVEWGARYCACRGDQIFALQGFLQRGKKTNRSYHWHSHQSKQMSLGAMNIQNDSNQVGQRTVHLIEHHDLNTHARLQVLFEEMIYIDCPN
jgi:hypothetical protein